MRYEGGADLELDTLMGRVRDNIEVDGRQCWTLFDTGSRNTYVVEDVASLGVVLPFQRPLRTALGGAVREVRETCMLVGSLQGHQIAIRALVLPDIGIDEGNKRIEILFGANDMQNWGIVPLPHEERIDMSNYPEMFIEFTEASL